MELNNNPNENFEYSGSPKNQDFWGIIFLVLVAVLCFYGAFYYNAKFENFENGKSLDIWSKFQNFYDMFGKWSVLVLFVAPGIILFYVAIVRYLKYKKTDYLQS